MTMEINVAPLGWQWKLMLYHLDDNGNVIMVHLKVWHHGSRLLSGCWIGNCQAITNWTGTWIEISSRNIDHQMCILYCLYHMNTLFVLPSETDWEWDWMRMEWEWDWKYAWWGGFGIRTYQCFSVPSWMQNSVLRSPGEWPGWCRHTRSVEPQNPCDTWG